LSETTAKAELARIRKVEEQWAEQDLRIKRGKLARETKIEEPIAWLSAATSKALSLPVSLSAKEVLTNPDAVAFVDSESGTNSSYPLVPGYHSPIGEKAQIQQGCSPECCASAVAHRRGTEIVELNMLNGGLLLDLELPHAWHTLTGQDTTTERLWMYIRKLIRPITQASYAGLCYGRKKSMSSAGEIILVR